MTLPTRALGRSGLIVSAQGLGCMGMSEFYGPGDEAESIATIHRALDLGVTFLETDKVEVITGLNLAMLMKLARPLKDTDLLTLAREMREHGRNAIWVASDLIRGEKT